MNKEVKKVEGARSVYRALELLDLIARHHEDGIGLSVLVAETGLDRATVYRLVSTLKQEHLVERDPDSRCYRLGMEAMQIGLATMSRAPILDGCVPAMRAIANESEDTVFLVVRNGDYAHCLHLEQGSFLIRTVVQHVGGLRLLGLGTAGQALLATLPDKEIEGIYRRHQDEYTERGFSSDRLWKTMAQIRSNGYTRTVDIITPGVHGIGVAFEVGYGGYAGVSVVAISERMSPARQVRLVELIRAQLHKGGFMPATANVSTSSV